MAQCIIVYFLPVTFHKCRDEQQQGALWLMEVGDNFLHNLVVVTRGNDDLRAGMQGLHAVAVQIVEDALQ